MSNDPFSELNRALNSLLGLNNMSYKTSKHNDLFSMLFPDFSSGIKGRIGEEMVRVDVENRIPGYYRIVNNILVPIGSVKTEIDMIMIHEKGLFVFEAKNYGGWIFGSEEQGQWTQVMPGGKKYRFYNPLLQNRTHCDAVSKLLSVTKQEIYSYIVFMDRCELKSVPGNTMYRTLIKRDAMSSEIIKDLLIREKLFDKEKVDELYDLLVKYIPTEAELQEHRNRIKRK